MAREDDIGGAEQRSCRQFVPLRERGQDILAERDDLVEELDVCWSAHVSKSKSRPQSWDSPSFE